MEQKGEPDLEPDPDPDFAYPCMRCAQRVVLTEELMTGSNLCCFSQDVPCAYCYMRKADCHPVSDPAIRFSAAYIQELME